MSVTTTGECAVGDANRDVKPAAANLGRRFRLISGLSGVHGSFSTTAGGTGPFHYAWTLDGNPTTATARTYYRHEGYERREPYCQRDYDGNLRQRDTDGDINFQQNTSTSDPARPDRLRRRHGHVLNERQWYRAVPLMPGRWTAAPYNGDSPTISVNTSGMSQGAHTVYRDDHGERAVARLKPPRLRLTNARRYHGRE